MIEENENYLKSYESISKDVKYITNSLSRLKIIATLYENPKSMKSLTEDTGLSYSSVSSTMHKLELENFVYRQSSKYHLTNSMKMQIENILELNKTIDVINKFFNILDKHLVDMIPNESIAEIYLIGQASLIESDDIDAYRTYNYIENALMEAEFVKCILPFYYENFNNQLNNMVKNNKYVEMMVSSDILSVFEEKSEIKSFSSFKKEDNFLLIVTDKVMILGLFKEDGSFDQNRLLISKNSNSLKWADNLYENFKNLNK
ncbi:helix-turn-helix transcriptional regulator [Methanobrevibacter sp.]|uniref:helix-turn-helix transcriptional regulator n=1 Tax=Methanobrevibacter sp. TaxID=66852 RepID=UPI003867313E